MNANESRNPANDLTNIPYPQLFETAPDAMIVVDSSARIVIVNRQAEMLFGYARSQLVGQPLDVLVPPRLRSRHACHVARFLGLPEARSMAAGFDLLGQHKDGTELPVEISLTPLGAGPDLLVSVALRVVTERKQLEAVAKLHAERLQSAVENLHDGFALFDDQRRLVLCNAIYRALIGETVTGSPIGKSYDELLDAGIEELVFEDDAAKRRYRAQRLADFTSTKTFDVRTRDGRALRIADRATPEGGVVRTVWDLTDDQRRNDEFREARRAAEAGSAAKTEFLSSMSHELRTPLNAILGFAQLLRRDTKQPLAERHRERVAHILKGGEHLLRLIDDVLDLSRIEAGAVSISMEPVRVRDVLDEVRQTLEPIATHHQVSIAIDPLPSELPMVGADRTRFAQVLLNFGSNAIKYNRPGGSVRFCVELKAPDLVRIAVHDTGIGIPAEKQQQIFQPFQRAGQETGPIQGTGIGLVITKRLAELMQGTVGFHSVVDEGSAFWVDMLADGAGARSSRPPTVRSDGSIPPLGGGKRVVLYVEDNPANVAFMRDMAASLDDIQLVAIPTAELGIELARACQPAAIIIDINLPGMSGLDALRELRASPETKNIPVIALTAAASEREKQRGLREGFFRYLTKPVKVELLLQTMESALGAPIH